MGDPLTTVTCPHCGDVSYQHKLIGQFVCGVCDRPFAPPQSALMRWAVRDNDGDVFGPLHERREDAERAVQFMNHYNPGLRRTVYRLALLRMEEVSHD